MNPISFIWSEDMAFLSFFDFSEFFVSYSFSKSFERNWSNTYDTLEYICEILMILNFFFGGEYLFERKPFANPLASRVFRDFSVLNQNLQFIWISKDIGATCFVPMLPGVTGVWYCVLNRRYTTPMAQKLQSYRVSKYLYA